MTLRSGLSERLVRWLFPQAPWLGPVLRRALPGCLLVVGLSLTAAAAGLAIPMVTKSVIDEGILGGDFRALVFWASVAFVIGLATVAFGVVSAMQHMRASQGMLGDLRLRVLEAALNRCASRPPLTVGETQIRIDSDTAEIQRFLFDSLLVAVTSVFRLCGGLGLMLVLDWRLALLPLMAAPLELWFLSWARHGTRDRAEVVRDHRGDVNAQLTESLAQLTRLRPLGAMRARHADFGALQDDLFTAQRRQRLWTEGVGAVSQTLAATLRAAVLLLGGWLVIRGDWQIGSLVAFLAYASMMSNPLRNLLGLYHAQARAQVAASRLSGVMAAVRPPDAGHAVPRPVRLLELDGVVAVGGCHDPVTAALTAGQSVLLDGPSGIGKSRLLAALLGEAPLLAGAIRVNGADHESLSLTDRRRAIRLVAQRPCLIRGSLRENLVLGGAEVAEPRLWDALDIVGLRHWAEQAGGLETCLDETGQCLSGGMRQRIALARAVIRASDIVVFDESFSEIDAPTTRDILARLQRRLAGRLLVFTAHSGPVRHLPFDQVVVIGPTRGTGTVLAYPDKAPDGAVAQRPATKMLGG